MTGSARELLFTPEQVAERLGLHVRTVRRYIREGQLDAVKVGKRYRVTREALEAFAGVALEPETTEARPSAEVSTTVSIDDLDREAADRLTTLLLASAQGRPSRDGPLRMETLYHPERRRLKVVCIGELAPATAMLALINALLESRS